MFSAKKNNNFRYFPFPSLDGEALLKRNVLFEQGDQIHCPPKEGSISRLRKSGGQKIDIILLLLNKFS